MPTVRFINILATQRPFPIGTDANARSLFSCNFVALAAAPVDKLEELVAQILVEQVPPLAVVSGASADTWGSNVTAFPTGDGPYTSIIDTGGVAPTEGHNSEYENLSWQVIVRAKSYATARTRALAIWRALKGQRNRIVTVS